MFTTFWFSREATASHFFTLKLMKKYTVKLISQRDGSIYLPFPEEIIKEYGFNENDIVEIIHRKEGGFIIKPMKKKYKLDDLIKYINEDDKHGEIDFGEAQGNEEW